MPRFAANLSMLFTEVPFPRPLRARRQGRLPRRWSSCSRTRTPPPRSRQRLDANGLKLVLHNLRPATGTAASAASPATRTASTSFAPASPRRSTTPRRSARRSSTAWPARRRPAWPTTAAPHLRRQPALRRRRAEEGRAQAADRADQPLRHSRLLPEPHRAGAGGHRRGRRRQPAFVQYDIYHAQRMEGELAATMQKHLAQIGHIQLADNPGPQRAGHRRDQLRVPVRAPRPDRLQGLDRLRIQAGRSHRGRPRLAAARAQACAHPLIDRSTTEHADMTSTSAPQARLHRPGHHGRADGGPPDQGRPPALRLHARQGARRDHRRRRHRLHQRARAWPSAPTSSSPWCPTRPTWRRCCSARTASPPGSKGKTVVDMSSISPIATKEFAQADQRARLRLPRRAGLRRRGRREGRVADHHGRRPRGGVRARQAAVRADGQEHHAGRRQRRRPDLPRSPTRSSSR